MYTKFNINDTVKVKLTEHGKQIHQQQWDRYLRRGQIEYTPPREDENGYSRWQMWNLMETFGPHMSLGVDCPFETDILIEYKWSE